MCIRDRDKNCKAEQVDLKKVFDGDSKYDLIVDLVSKDLPFYESYIKTAALTGTRVIQDPFQEVVQDRFFNINLAADLRLDTPKAALIPAKNQEDGLAENMNWESIFKYVGFPALLRPVYGVEEQPKQKIDNADEFRNCLLYTSPSPRDATLSRMPSSA